MPIAVPEGATPGLEVTAMVPNGQQVTVTVTEGVAAGQQLEVQVPVLLPEAPVRLHPCLS